MNLKEFKKNIKEGKITWWKMNLPSGEVFFGEDKALMLGYDPADFKHYKDFTSLLHKDDYEKAMRDHIDGKKDYYITDYRIKTSKGTYVKFLDVGKNFNKKGKKIILMGIVIKVKNKKQEEEYKDLILNKKTVFRDLVLNVVK